MPNTQWSSVVDIRKHEPIDTMVVTCDDTHCGVVLGFQETERAETVSVGV